jgi:adenylosuccinate synthase
MKISVVLGLMFGDEGKGKVTDYLCSQSNSEETIVIRFSGGQQAGHNVRINDKTHVHSNFGSGTLRGFPSYFTEDCTIYPTTMMRERISLINKGITPNIFFHPLTMVTTPYDVAYNRLIEKKNNHGSCGLGVGATMKRNLETGYKLYAIDLQNINFFNQKLKSIDHYYRSKIDNSFELEFYNQEVGREWFDFTMALKTLTFNIRLYSFLNNFYHLIFEGSQGILLDMDHGIFPNVTYGNTTFKNAKKIYEQYTISFWEINIFYITRCYQTRHGNGWMSNETKIDLINNEDEINVFNDWQKNFRIGEIDYDLINHSLAIDNIYSHNIKEKNIVVTCMDQRPGFEFDVTKINNYNDYKILFSKGSDTSNISL